MTRFASIMGVAAVATLILLSGCETVVRTDYAKKLEGTWTNGPAAAMVANPSGPGATPAQLPVMRTVTAEVTRDGVNKGSFSIDGIRYGQCTSECGPTCRPTCVEGLWYIRSGDATEITIIIPANGIQLPLGQSPPDQLAALIASPQVLGWELSNDDSELRLSGLVLMGLQITASPTEKYLLTMTASGS